MQDVTSQLLDSLFLGLNLFKNLMNFVLISSLVNYESHSGIFHSNMCRYKEIFGHLLPFSGGMELNPENRDILEGVTGKEAPHCACYLYQLF